MLPIVGPPIAYLLTWTTYGTWLHGDHRGSVDDDHRTPGQPFALPQKHRETIHKSRLLRPPVQLDQAARRVVDKAIHDHCAFRQWRIVAVNVRSNHVHVVVEAAEPHTPEQMLAQLKSWATRRLRETGHIQADARVWTHHGSTRYLWTQEQVHAAGTYVAEHQ